MRRIALAVCCVAAIASCGDDDDDPIDAGTVVDAAPSADVNNNAAPTASFTITPTCTSAPTTDIDFVSTSTDPESDTLTCMWTFSSATNSPVRNLCTVTGVRFPHFQPYPVTLVVDDGNGNTDMLVQTVAPCI